MLALYWLSILGPPVAWFCLGLGMAAGVVCSPFVAGSCWMAARRRGVPPGRYAALGLVYSWFLLYPGLLLLFSLWRPLTRLRHEKGWRTCFG